MEVACQKNALVMRIAQAARAHDEHAHVDQWCTLLSLAHPMRILAVIHSYECTDLLDDK